MAFTITESEFFALEQRLRQTELLYETAQYLTSSLQFDEVMTRVLDRTLKVIEAANAGVLFIFDKQRNQLIPSACSGFGWGAMQGVFLSPGESMTGLTFQQRRAKIFHDPNSIIQQTMSQPNQDLYMQSLHPLSKSIGGSFRIRSVMCSPLLLKGECIGVMTLDNLTEHSFTQDDLALLVTLCNQAAIALENARLYQEEGKQRAELLHLNGVVQRQNEQLLRINQTHEKLMFQVLSGGTMDELGQMVADILGNSVIVYDDLFTVLTSQGVTNLQVDFPFLIRKLQKTALTRQPMHLQKNTVGKLPYAMTLFPIVTSRQFLGILLVAETNHSFDEHDQVLVEQCNLVLAVDLLKREAVYESEQHIKGNFLEELITEGNIGVLKERAKTLGLTDEDLHVFMVIDVQVNLQQSGGTEAERVNRQIHKMIERYLLSRNRHSLVIAKLNTTVAVLTMSRELNTATILKRTKAMGMALIEHLQQSYKRVNCAIGIGRIGRNVPEFLQSYNDAKQCIAVIKSTEEVNVVKDYIEMGATRFIVSQPKQQMLEFAFQTLRPLLEYPSGKRVELLRALDAFMLSGKQHKEASCMLGIHPNTLAYRLRRVEEVLGYSMNHPSHYFDLLFAWQVVTVYNLKQDLLMSGVVASFT